MTLSTPSRARLTTPPAGSPAGARISAASRRSGPGRHRAGFWLVALAFLTAMAFSTAPTPLYPLYQARDGFSTFTVTIVFAVYAIGVVISLLLAGHISDRVGRKKILIPALTLELVLQRHSVIRVAVGGRGGGSGRCGLGVVDVVASSTR